MLHCVGHQCVGNLPSSLMQILQKETRQQVSFHGKLLESAHNLLDSVFSLAPVDLLAAACPVWYANHLAERSAAAQACAGPSYV